MKASLINAKQERIKALHQKLIFNSAHPYYIMKLVRPRLDPTHPIPYTLQYCCNLAHHNIIIILTINHDEIACTPINVISGTGY
jgi:hypothetical protein